MCKDTSAKFVAETEVWTPWLCGCATPPSFLTIADALRGLARNSWIASLAGRDGSLRRLDVSQLRSLAGPFTPSRDCNDHAWSADRGCLHAGCRQCYYPSYVKKF